MRIKIINPNTTEELTKGISISAHYFSRPDTEIICVNPEKGPVSLEGYYDEHIAEPQIIEEVLKSEQEGQTDAYVIACFGDPALYALREITDKPVVGVAESAIALAGFICAKFSIVAIMPRMRMKLQELIHRCGAERRVASVRTPNLTVLDFHRDFEGCKRILINEAKEAIEKDYAEAILLGCAGMAGFAEEVQKEVKVPVFDAVASAVKVAEALVDMKLKTSKALTFRYPESKEIKGMSELLLNSNYKS